ncbi:cyclo(L-tyrosyl-L-tyrosyl) synthase [Streptomyces cellulosae]|nr:cyclo(L-tyrosyl-L-tyrosyl) synthase [Streptomyces cellulosae]
MSESSERFVARPLSGACVDLLARAEHACLGISPFNSYFSVQRIKGLAVWAHERFEQVDFFVPDAPSAYTFQALGYASEKAAWKPRRQGQHTRNRNRTALDMLGVAEGAGHVWGWAELEGNASFARLHAEGHELYAGDEEFRRACREVRGWVLSGRLPAEAVPNVRQVECAVRYFLAELPLFVDTPAIVGAETSVFCYHRPSDILRRLYGRQLARHPAPVQGFAVVVPLE